MDFVILGSLEVIEGGRPLPLGGVKQRALLAILLLHANEVVSRDRLIEGIWPGRLPAGPTQTLDTYVSRLRKLLGPDRILRRADGFALTVAPQELDLNRFEDLAVRGEFAKALAVWRGPALADLRFEPFASAEAERLEERRLDVLEERIEADLRTRRGVELVSELERLVREHPMRERLVGQLMLALYRAGRQAAALEEYRRAKRRLSEELGLEPGPQLQELERRILEHDPSLGKPLSGSRQPERRLRRVPIAVALLLAAGAAAAIVTVTRWAPASSATQARTSRLLAVPIGSQIISGTAVLPAAPNTIGSASGSLWLADAKDQSVLQVDPSSDAIVDRIPVGGEPGSLVAGGGAVWVASTLGGTIERLDPASETISQTIRLGQESTTAIAFRLGSVWVADATDDALIELDAKTGTAKRTVRLNVRPTSLVVSNRAIWVADDDAGSVSEVDLPSGQTAATIHVGNGPVALVLGAGALWVANNLDSTVSRINPETGAVVATIPVGSGPASLAFSGGALWVANEYSGTVSRIDPRRNAVTATLRVGGTPIALAGVSGRLWVGAGPEADVPHRGTLRLAWSIQPLSIDPAIYAQAAPAQFTTLAYDTLVTFARTDGPGGLQLVPDLALAVPSPTGDGRTYAFRLRPGIRYSDGRLLRASDFLRTFERLYRVNSPGIDYYTAIVGARACGHDPMRCDLSHGVVADDRAGTVVFHLTRPDPDFLFKLTEYGFSAPLPRGVPEHDAGYRPLPGTGPYEISLATTREIRFVRNPFFREWSHSAQPAGIPDSIVWTFPSGREQTIREVESGRTDWTLEFTSQRQTRAIRTRDPSLLRANPLFGVDFIPLNTHVAPFDDVRVRRALNFAIDRRKILQMYGGSFVAAPTCQPLTPGLAGYQRYCPYTVDPSADGAYHGPDLARAQRLVAASGTRGDRVDVWGATDQGVVPPQEAFYIGRVLRSLGYRVQVHLHVRFASITMSMRRRIQLSVDGDWVPDYPSPSSYLSHFFGCNGGYSNGYVCNRGLDTEMAHALALQLSNPEAAAALWRRVDHPN